LIGDTINNGWIGGEKILSEELYNLKIEKNPHHKFTTFPSAIKD